MKTAFTDNLKESALEYIRNNLKVSRLEHTLRVVDEAAVLSKKYGTDPEKTEICALLHDMAKNMDQDQMNDFIRSHSLPEKYYDNQNLAHGKIAAVQIQEIFGVNDQEMINAVSYHTTGRADMSVLEKVIFLADAIEPGRKYPGVNDIRKAAETDLDKACFLMLDRTIKYIKSKGHYLDSDTIRARDYLLNKGDKAYE